MKKYNYTYAEWSQDTKTWEIESDKQLTEEEVIGIASNSSMDEKLSYSTKDFVCKYQGTLWGDDAQFEVIGDTKKC
jgi:hypothetical protein